MTNQYPYGSYYHYEGAPQQQYAQPSYPANQPPPPAPSYAVGQPPPPHLAYPSGQPPPPVPVAHSVTQPPTYTYSYATQSHHSTTYLQPTANSLCTSSFSHVPQHGAGPIITSTGATRGVKRKRKEVIDLDGGPERASDGTVILVEKDPHVPGAVGGKRYSKNKITKASKKWLKQRQPDDEMKAWFWKGVGLNLLEHHLQTVLPGINPETQGYGDFKEMVENIHRLQVIVEGRGPFVRLSPKPPRDLADVNDFIYDYIKDREPEDKVARAFWTGVDLSKLHSALQKELPRFKYQSYGFKKWRKFVQYIPHVEIHNPANRGSLARLFVPFRESIKRQATVKNEALKYLEQGKIRAFGMAKADVLEHFQNSNVTKETVSWSDPLTLSQINIPAKGTCCDHLRPFDLAVYLKVNMFGNMQSRWMCPICGKKVLPESLYVDGYWLAVATHRNVRNLNVDSLSVYPDGRILATVTMDSETSCTSEQREFMPKYQADTDIDEDDLYHETDRDFSSSDEEDSEDEIELARKEARRMTHSQNMKKSKMKFGMSFKRPPPGRDDIDKLLDELDNPDPPDKPAPAAPAAQPVLSGLIRPFGFKLSASAAKKAKKIKASRLRGHRGVR